MWKVWNASMKCISGKGYDISLIKAGFNQCCYGSLFLSLVEPDENSLELTTVFISPDLTLDDFTKENHISWKLSWVVLTCFNC